jgi:hypothetical protein
MRNRDVFINCPFSTDYSEFFHGTVFAVLRSGFKPRCALEVDDGSDNRFDKICRIIGECKLGVHDISKTETDGHSGLPRFNMPLELGLFLAAKKFGGPAQSRKKCIIFDRDKYRYQKFISDISGQDIHAHQGKVRTLISELAGWLRSETGDPRIPGGAAINAEFKVFSRQLPLMLKEMQLKRTEMTFLDYRKLAGNWIVESQR